MHEKLYALKEDFLRNWPIEKLEKMTLEEYTNLDKTSFCYWIEQTTRDLGSVAGGSSYKFGIYKMADTSKTEKASNRTNNGIYAWHTKYGETQEEAFRNVKDIIIKVVTFAQSNSLEIIDNIDLGHAYKWKIAFMYGNFNCLNVFKIDALHVIANSLGIEFSSKTPISKLHKEIINRKPEEKEYFSWSHELWKHYQARLRDVKKEFAKWLNNNTFDSYRSYLGETNKSIERKLDEINDFFDEIDFFLVDPKNVNGLVSTILFLLSKKERLKNPEFVEYDLRNSNGIPKAILGKNNYIKFLKEKFDYQDPNYWIFQGNPNIFKITDALKDGNLQSWKIVAHKDKIKIGDQVIIWQTGNDAGCYALAEVVSEVGVFEEKYEEKQYYANKDESIATDRVRIKILKNLADSPILWDDLKDNLLFSNFKAGNQGTNFSATQEQFNTLLHWDLSKSTKYWLFAPGEKASEWNEFYDNNFIALGWDELGDLSQYNSKKEIYNALYENYGGEGDKKNDVAANYDFVNEMHIGDIIIAKTGRSKLLGYGIVSSDYYFDDGRDQYMHCRKVDWKKKGVWEVDHTLVLKTLTDITPYNESHGYKKYYEYLMSILLNEYKKGTINKLDESAKNHILYGPPGTGKTFFLKEQLFDKYTLKEEAVSKEKYFEEVVANITWWQAITLALIEEGKSNVSAILENRWVAIKASLSESKNVRATIWGTLQMHTIEESTSVNYKQRQAPLIFDKTEDKSWVLLEQELKEQAPEIFKIKYEVDNFQVNTGKSIMHYDFVTFHQSFSYEDFIEGIKPIFPENDEETTDLGYAIEDGVFKRLCLRAKNDPENRYAIFIDEINRGNVSAIFGELITLIEPDKRSGEKNELSVKLPYSKKEFTVPSNLDIYGTMNTADRSVEALDTALRRRFEFMEMMPDYSVIENETVDGIQLSKVLETINQRIELLIDRDHTIGHSYFVNVDTTDKLADAFNNKIVPLLQEYFYGDYGKIGLVLGKGFIDKINNDKIDFAHFDYENANDFKTPTFVLKQVDGNGIVDAVNLLLGLDDKASE